MCDSKMVLATRMPICRVLPPRADPRAGFATAYVAHAINILQSAEQQNVHALLDSNFRPASLGNSSWETFFEPVLPACPPGSTWYTINKSEQWYRNLKLRNPHSVHQWQDQTKSTQLRYNGTWFAHQRSEGARIFQRYIRVRPELVAHANHLFDRLMGGRACIGLHLRGTDKSDGRIKTNLTNAFGAVDKRLKMGKERMVFLATDDEDFLVAATARYGDGVLRYLSAMRARGRRPTYEIHNPVQASHEVLIDVLCLAKCSYLVAGASAVSEMVFYMSQNLHNQSLSIDYLYR